MRSVVRQHFIGSRRGSEGVLVEMASPFSYGARRPVLPMQVLSEWNS